LKKKKQKLMFKLIFLNNLTKVKEFKKINENIKK
jgi:hypothetical protein